MKPGQVAFCSLTAPPGRETTCGQLHLAGPLPAVPSMPSRACGPSRVALGALNGDRTCQRGIFIPRACVVLPGHLPSCRSSATLGQGQGPGGPLLPWAEATLSHGPD